MHLKIGDEIAISGENRPFRVIGADDMGNPVVRNVKMDGSLGKTERKITYGIKYKVISLPVVEIKNTVTPEWIQEKMNQTGVKLKDISEFTGIYRQQLSNWITGEKPMSHACKVMFYLYFLKL